MGTASVRMLRQAVTSQMGALSVDIADVKLVFRGITLQDFVVDAVGEVVPNLKATPTSVADLNAGPKSALGRDISVGDTPLSLIRLQRTPPCNNFTTDDVSQKARKSPHQLCSSCMHARQDHHQGKKKACPLLTSGNFHGAKRGDSLSLTLPSKGAFTVWEYPRKETGLDALGIASNGVVLLLRDKQPSKKLHIRGENIGSGQSFLCHPCTGINGLMNEMRRRCRSTESSSEFSAVDVLELMPEGNSKAVLLGKISGAGESVFASQKLEGSPKCLCDFHIPDGSCMVFKTKLVRRKKVRGGSNSARSATHPSACQVPRERQQARRSSLPILPSQQPLPSVRCNHSAPDCSTRARGSWSEVLQTSEWESIRAAHAYVQEVVAVPTPPMIRITQAEINRESRCFHMQHGEDVCCCICLGAFEGEHTEARELNCGHRFHKCCIDKWLLAAPAPTCPYCKQEMGVGTMRDHRSIQSQ